MPCSKFGGIDILINNAGIIPRGTILETTDDMWFSALDVNLTAVFFLCRAAIPHMQQAGVAPSSILHRPGAFIPGRVTSPTAPARPRWRHSPKTWRAIMPADGIRVNAVCPNEVNTPMLRSGFARRGIDPDNASRGTRQDRTARDMCRTR